MNCITIITGFPVMKEARSWLDWLTFSCSCAKSYITDEPAQHVEALTWLSCQKVQEKFFPITSPPGPKPWGNPSTGEGDACKHSRLRKRLLSGYPAVPQQKLCVWEAASTRLSIGAIYP